MCAVADWIERCYFTEETGVDGGPPLCPGHQKECIAGSGVEAGHPGDKTFWKCAEKENSSRCSFMTERGVRRAEEGAGSIPVGAAICAGGDTPAGGAGPKHGARAGPLCNGHNKECVLKNGKETVSSCFLGSYCMHVVHALFCGSPLEKRGV
ncbi:unnamed protein product [Pylaiella littoralis]